MQRRDILKAGALAALPAPAFAQGAAARTLRVIPQANLTSLDPFWTTAVVTRNHGYLVYDTLYALDSKGEVRPQMVEGHVIEDGGLSWTLTLRPGLRFHDNVPVRSIDCTTSIARFCVRDGFGQSLAAALDEMVVLDDRRFRLRLKRPFPQLAMALGKVNGCFVMPERLARVDAFTQIREAVGSGPFRFLRDEWNPGSRASYAKFEGYQPRQEVPDGLAGGRAPRIDRVEWTIIPDSATAANTIATGEQDYWEYPLHDLLPMLRRGREVVVQQRLLEGTYGVMRFNSLFPPFDKVEIRRAVAMAVDQREWLRAVAGDDPAGYAACEGIFTCGGPLETEVGSEILKVHSLERGRAALRAAGYAHERVVLLAPSDYPQINALSLVTADLLQRLGMNVDLVATDWGSLVQRRASREPPERGGWSMFHTTSGGSDVAIPPVHLYLRANGPNAWFGWPQDDAIEQLRAAWLDAADAAESRRIGDALNRRVLEVMPYVPLGYYWQPSAWRRNLTGVYRSFTTVFWGIGKA
jgi:peptide/nickel transport system substrate-binding protein